METNSGLVWERPEPATRSAPVPLSRDQIVQAALGIADAEGLDGVSLRKVGAALNAGPMRLYGYMSTKEELLDLMADAVYGEMASTETLPDNWRAATRALAHRVRQAVQKHPWFLDLLGGRPHLGPKALAHLEASLASLRGMPGFDDASFVFQAFRTVNAYVIGTLQSEESEVLAERESGLSKKEWQNATGPYIKRMIGTGRFPAIAKVVLYASHPSPAIVFDRGLDCVLDGIEARVAL